MSNGNNPDNLDSKLEQLIIKLLLGHPEGVTIPYIVTTILKTKEEFSRAYCYESLRIKVYRLLERWIKEGIVEKITTNLSPHFYKINCAEHVIDLINVRGLSKIQTATTNFIKTLDKINIDEVVGKLKALAILKRSSPMLSEEVINEITTEFLSYIDDINEKRLLFIIDDEYIDQSDETNYLMLPYLTRFNNPNYWVRFNRETRMMFKEASKRYKWAVHITLTVDPKQFDNHVEMVYEARKQINSFLTNLRKQTQKKKGKKLCYIKFCEFTNSGLIHFHIIVFGQRYIKPVREIAENMWKLGFVFAYQLVNSKGKWTYPRSKPADYYEKVRKVKQTYLKYLNDGGEKAKDLLNTGADVYFYFNIPIPEEEIDDDEGDDGGYTGSGIDKKDKKRDKKKKDKKKRDKKDKRRKPIKSSDYEGFDSYYLLNLVLYWAYNIRIRTNSRDLQIKRNKVNKPKNYRFLGSYYIFELDDLFAILNLDINPYELYYIPYSYSMEYNYELEYSKPPP